MQQWATTVGRRSVRTNQCRVCFEKADGSAPVRVRSYNLLRLSSNSNLFFLLRTGHIGDCSLLMNRSVVPRSNIRNTFRCIIKAQHQAGGIVFFPMLFFFELVYSQAFPIEDRIDAYYMICETSFIYCPLCIRSPVQSISTIISFTIPLIISHLFPLIAPLTS